MPRYLVEILYTAEVEATSEDKARTRVTEALGEQYFNIDSVPWGVDGRERVKVTRIGGTAKRE